MRAQPQVPAPGQFVAVRREPVQTRDARVAPLLTVAGFDAVSGTPVVDLKPTMAEFLPVRIKQPEWVGRLMSEYSQP